MAAISGMLAVALGALGAHYLEKQLAPQKMEIWEKAVRYQFYHTLVLLILTILIKTYGAGRLIKFSAWLFAGGIVLFSGSLYLLSTRELTGLPSHWLGPLTPLGGISWIIAWMLLALGFLQNRNSRTT